MDLSETATARDDLEEGAVDLFHAAANHLATLVTANATSASDTIKLRLHGLYKQATVGPCNTSKPAVWDTPGVAKWNALTQLVSFGASGSNAAVHISTQAARSIMGSVTRHMSTGKLNGHSHMMWWNVM